MGAAIAAEYASGGHLVRITTSPRTPPAVALARVGSSGVTWSSSTTEAAEKADVVVESLPEALDLKRQELSVAQKIAPKAILATNTSSLTVTRIAAGLPDPTRLVGTHFFNPPSAIGLVELIPGKKSDPAVVDRMEAILHSLGKRPIRLRRDVAGFVINRLQFALLREAIELVDQGIVEPADLDRLVVEGLGRRWAAVGPLATVALGGPELFHRIAADLYPELSQRREPPPEMDRVQLSDAQVEALRTRRDRILKLIAAEFE
jgi:3-hydroxybutyryl-CoA dehydrogenase